MIRVNSIAKQMCDARERKPRFTYKCIYLSVRTYYDIC